MATPSPRTSTVGRRFRLAGWLAALAVAGAAALLTGRLLVNRRPIVVGILHSLTGPIAISERSMVDAEVLALEEINAAGGLLGRPVRWVIADGRSDWPTFAREAGRLLNTDRVSAVFGCWTSASRKAVLPLFESADHLLLYPNAYEGLEQSPNVVYVGAAPNQQVIPAVQWCHGTLGARRFLLVGSDYIWPRCVNAIVTDQIAGLGAELLGEVYVPFGSDAVEAAVARVVADRPDVVLCTVVGTSGLSFFQRLREAGISARDVPVMSFAFAEDELRSMPREAFVGHYAAWNYFQSTPGAKNAEFVRRFKDRYGQERVTSDVIAASYTAVKLWARAVEEAGTDDVRQVRSALRDQSLDAPEGIIAIDPQTQHAWRPVSIGRFRSDGQFDVVWTSRTAVRPVPFPITRSRDEWERLVSKFHARWEGWAAPAAGETAP
jgi:urea transport system substrate-binding protein